MVQKSVAINERKVSRLTMPNMQLPKVTVRQVVATL